jgi:cation-transporting ATPase 13A1
MKKPNMDVLLEHTWVYARVSPSQKVRTMHMHDGW